MAITRFITRECGNYVCELKKVLGPAAPLYSDADANTDLRLLVWSFQVKITLPNVGKSDPQVCIMDRALRSGFAEPGVLLPSRQTATSASTSPTGIASAVTRPSPNPTAVREHHSSSFYCLIFIKTSDHQCCSREFSGTQRVPLFHFKTPLTHEIGRAHV